MTKRCSFIMVRRFSAVMGFHWEEAGREESEVTKEQAVQSFLF